MLKSLRKQPDVNRVFIVINHKFSKQFEDWRLNLSNQIFDADIIKLIDDGTTTNETRLGPLGDIELVFKKHKITGDLLLLAGDNIAEISFSDFIKKAKRHHASSLCVKDFKIKSK